MLYILLLNDKVAIKIPSRNLVVQIKTHKKISKRLHDNCQGQ